MTGVFRHKPCPTCGQSWRVRNVEYLRVLREEHGLSLREVSRRMGFSAPYVSDVERNRRRISETFWCNYRLALKGVKP